MESIAIFEAEFDDVNGSVAAGLVYLRLMRLEKKGVLVVEEKEEDGGRRRGLVWQPFSIDEKHGCWAKRGKYTSGRNRSLMRRTTE